MEVTLSAARQRLIVTTDLGGSDPDDEQSMGHLLVSANEIDIERFDLRTSVGRQQDRHREAQ